MEAFILSAISLGPWYCMSFQLKSLDLVELRAIGYINTVLDTLQATGYIKIQFLAHNTCDLTLVILLEFCSLQTQFQ